MRECGAAWASFDTLQPGDTGIVVIAKLRACRRQLMGHSELLREGQGPVLDVKIELDRATLPPCVEL